MAHPQALHCWRHSPPHLLAAIHIPVTPWQSTKTTKTGQQCILSNTTPTHRNHHLVYDSSSVLWSLVVLLFFFFLAGWRLVPFSVYCLANWQWFVVARPCWTNWLETDATPTIQSNYSWCWPGWARALVLVGRCWSKRDLARFRKRTIMCTY